MPPEPFWEKSLSNLSPAEWEALCDGCGKCCLIKLQDEDTDAVYYTEVACRLLDLESCRCSNYPQRKRHVPDCVVLSPETIADLGWMPSTCAYRLRAEGKPLPDWHPLVTGDPKSVHYAGISVRGRVLGERDVAAHALPSHIVDWPE
jgi:hypothetical protein